MAVAVINSASSEAQARDKADQLYDQADVNGLYEYLSNYVAKNPNASAEIIWRYARATRFALSKYGLLPLQLLNRIQKQNREYAMLQKDPQELKRLIGESHELAKVNLDRESDVMMYPVS